MVLLYMSVDDETQPTTGEYDEKSIRYTGRHIPSRSFRILQNMTAAGADDVSPGNNTYLLIRLRLGE